MESEKILLIGRSVLCTVFYGAISAENMFGIWGDDMPPVNSLLDLQVLEFFTGGNVAIREFPVLLFEFASL